MATVSGGGLQGISAGEGVIQGAKVALDRQQQKFQEEQTRYAAESQAIQNEINSQYNGNIADWLNANPQNLVRYSRLKGFESGNKLTGIVQGLQDEGILGDNPMMQTPEQAMQVAYRDYTLGNISADKPAEKKKTPDPVPVTPEEYGKSAIDVPDVNPQENILSYDQIASKDIQNKMKSALTNLATGQGGKTEQQVDAEIKAQIGFLTADGMSQQDAYAKLKSLYTFDSTTGTYTAPKADLIKTSSQIKQNAANGMDEVTYQLWVTDPKNNGQGGYVTPLAPIIQGQLSAFTDKDGNIRTDDLMKYIKDSGAYELIDPTKDTGKPSEWKVKDNPNGTNWNTQIVVDKEGKFKSVFNPDEWKEEIKTQDGKSISVLYDKKITEPALANMQAAMESPNESDKVPATINAFKAIGSGWYATEQGNKKYGANKYLKSSALAAQMNLMDKAVNNEDWQKSEFMQRGGASLEAVLKAQQLAIEAKKLDFDYIKLAEDARQFDIETKKSYDYLTLQNQWYSLKSSGAQDFAQNVSGLTKKQQETLDLTMANLKATKDKLDKQSYTEWNDARDLYYKQIQGQYKNFSPTQIETLVNKAMNDRFKTNDYNTYLSRQYASTGLTAQLQSFTGMVGTLMPGHTQEDINKVAAQYLYMYGTQGSVFTGLPEGTTPDQLRTAKDPTLSGWDDFLSKNGMAVEGPAPSGTTQTPTAQEKIDQIPAKVPEGASPSPTKQKKYAIINGKQVEIP